VWLLQESAERVHQSIVLLADFALAIMSLLDRFNRNSFNYFKLRIGSYLAFFRFLFNMAAAAILNLVYRT